MKTPFKLKWGHKDKQTIALNVQVQCVSGKHGFGLHLEYMDPADGYHFVHTSHLSCFLSTY